MVLPANKERRYSQPIFNGWETIPFRSLEAYHPPQQSDIGWRAQCRISGVGNMAFQMVASNVQLNSKRQSGMLMLQGWGQSTAKNHASWHRIHNTTLAIESLLNFAGHWDKVPVGESLRLILLQYAHVTFHCEGRDVWWLEGKWLLF